MKCGLMRKVVTWEGIHVSALRFQTVSNDVCWVVTLAQCQLVRWLSVISLRNRNRSTWKLYRKKKFVKLLVSLFYACYFFKVICISYTMPRNCVNSPDNFCYICKEVTFSTRKLPLTPMVKKLMNAISVAKSETKTKNGLLMYVVSLVLQFYANG